MITLTFSRITSGPATPETVLYSAISATLEEDADPGLGGFFREPHFFERRYHCHRIANF